MTRPRPTPGQLQALRDLRAGMPGMAQSVRKALLGLDLIGVQEDTPYLTAWGFYELKRDELDQEEKAAWAEEEEARLKAAWDSKTRKKKARKKSGKKA